MDSIVLVYTTFSNLEEARAISEELLNKKLIICVNIFPKVNSLYLWKGEIHNSYEIVTIMKKQKRSSRWNHKKIEAMHSYDQPAVIVIPIEKTNKSFTNWVNNVLI